MNPRDDVGDLRRLLAFVETRRRDLAAQGGSAGTGALANAEALLATLRQGLAYAQQHLPEHGGAARW